MFGLLVLWQRDSHCCLRHLLWHMLFNSTAQHNAVQCSTFGFQHTLHTTCGTAGWHVISSFTWCAVGFGQSQTTREPASLPFDFCSGHSIVMARQNPLCKLFGFGGGWWWSGHQRETKETDTDTAKLVHFCLHNTLFSHLQSKKDLTVAHFVVSRRWKLKIHSLSWLGHSTDPAPTITVEQKKRLQQVCWVDNKDKIGFLWQMCALSCLQCTSGSAQQSGQWQHTAKKQLSLNWFDQLWQENLCQSEQKTGWGVPTWLLLSSCCQQQRLRCPHQQKSAVDKWNDNTQWQVKWQEEVRHFEFLTPVFLDEKPS